MDIFNNSISLDKLIGEGDDEMDDFRLQHLTINEDLKKSLWTPEKCISIVFDRCWDVNRLTEFLSLNFRGIKYLQLICKNYMTTEDGKSFDFKNFPKTITHLHIKCATDQKFVGFISVKYLDETSLQWLMIHGRVEESNYILPKTLTCFVRACKNNDSDKQKCLTPFALEHWSMISNISSKLPEFDFKGNKSFMEIYTREL